MLRKSYVRKHERKKKKTSTQENIHHSSHSYASSKVQKTWTSTLHQQSNRFRLGLEMQQLRRTTPQRRRNRGKISSRSSIKLGDCMNKKQINILYYAIMLVGGWCFMQYIYYDVSSWNNKTFSNIGLLYLIATFIIGSGLHIFIKHNEEIAKKTVLGWTHEKHSFRNRPKSI